MTQPIIIAPSILAADPGAYGAEIQDVAAAGADWIHIDVMDGSFVPPITFGDNIVKVAKRACKLFLDTHLMVVHPETHFEAFKKAGADRVIIHQETCPRLRDSLKAAKDLGLQAGVAINPTTPVASVFEVADIVDLILIMTVNPGWGGQSFIEACLPKIESLRSELDRRKLPTLIEVDGGINEKTAPRCIAAGARVLVAGSAIFGATDRKLAIARLRS